MRKDSKLQKKKFRTKRHQMQENCYLPVFFCRNGSPLFVFHHMKLVKFVMEISRSNDRRYVA